jgi:Holliday junction resolvasome RuvABC endonuclease subunit
VNVLGLDLSLTQTGYCMVEDVQPAMKGLLTGVTWHGAIGFPDLRGGERLARFYAWLDLDVARLHRPDRVAIEGYSFGSPFHATDIGELGGVVKLVLWRHEIPLTIVPPSTWRAALVGRVPRSLRGPALKAHIRSEIFRRYGVSFPRMDTLEAWAVATYCRRLSGVVKAPVEA